MSAEAELGGAPIHDFTPASGSSRYLSTSPPANINFTLMAAATPSASNSTSFQFPPHYSFPPFFTIQPNVTTRQSQLHSWSALIQSYARHHRLFQLSLVDALDTDLFYNRVLGRRLALRDAREVLSWMASPDGGQRVEWVGGEKDGGKAGRCWVYWRRPEEWAGVIEDWVSDL